MNDMRGSVGPDDQPRIDAAFLTIVRTPELHGVDLDVDVEEQRRDIRRIASTVFCSSDIDPFDRVVRGSPHGSSLGHGP